MSNKFNRELAQKSIKWILDEGFTPFAAVDSHDENIVVPEELKNSGILDFDLSPHAIRDLKLTDFAMQFNATFLGVPSNVIIPYSAVIDIFASENENISVSQTNDNVTSILDKIMKNTKK